MSTNITSPNLWKQDVWTSVDYYNQWFLKFAPQAYRNARNAAIRKVEESFLQTQNFSQITPNILRENPRILSILRMATAPPVARDRLIGLAGVSKNFVLKMEDGCMPPRMDRRRQDKELEKIISMLIRLLDIDIFPWIETQTSPSATVRRRAASIVADRVCGAMSDPIIRNAQEERQLAAISQYLNQREYTFIPSSNISDFREMPVGGYSYHLNVSVFLSNESESTVNIPVDVVIKRKNCPQDMLPLLIECKSAGDFTNTNKRRKEEALKAAQLRYTYNNAVEYILFLCGYFDTGYLGYEAAEGIDWIWEHRIDDLAEKGI